MKTPNQTDLINFVKENYALVGILIGAALVSVSLGPYTNFDSQAEYDSAVGVVNVGLPYVTPGNLINQPPIGFYINALFLRLFGLSYPTGVTAVTLFGVGAVFLVYQIGKRMYSSRTALIAASLFALTPWQVVMSRSFLIDAECLFFSLLSLLVGIWAVRRSSLKLTLVSGVVFGVAFLTKLFAVFTLIPLALLFLNQKPRNFKFMTWQVALFVLPSFFLYSAWYEGISKLGFFSVLTHTDFLSTSQQATPSPFFLLSFLMATPGLFFLLAAGISVFLAFWAKRFSKEAAFFDFACLATVVGTAAVNMYLVLGLGLWVPYIDPFKYDYQLLPALCWLAASLAHKMYSFAGSGVQNLKRRRIFFGFAVVGVFFVVGAFLMNMEALMNLTRIDYLLFKVEGDIAFSFTTFTPTAEQPPLALLQGLGFMIIVGALLWGIRDRLPFKKRLRGFQGSSNVPATRSLPPSRCETTARSPGR